MLARSGQRVCTVVLVCQFSMAVCNLSAISSQFVGVQLGLQSATVVLVESQGFAGKPDAIADDACAVLPIGAEDLIQIAKLARTSDLNPKIDVFADDEIRIEGWC